MLAQPWWLRISRRHNLLSISYDSPSDDIDFRAVLKCFAYLDRLWCCGGSPVVQLDWQSDRFSRYEDWWFTPVSFSPSLIQSILYVGTFVYVTYNTCAVVLWVHSSPLIFTFFWIDPQNAKKCLTKIFLTSQNPLSSSIYALQVGHNGSSFSQSGFKHPLEVLLTLWSFFSTTGLN